MHRPRHRPARTADRLLAALIVLGWMLVPLWPALANGQSGVVLAGSEAQLQLEVLINGHAANTIAPITQHADGTLSTTRAVFDDLDLALPGEGAPGDVVRLDAVAGLTYRYDQQRQTIDLTMPEGMRRAKSYDARVDKKTVQAGVADYGALVNYSLYSSAQQGLNKQTSTGRYLGFNGVNATLDGRFITPFGTLNQSGLVGTVPGQRFNYSTGQSGSDVEALRYATTFTRVDPESLMTYRFGDAVAGGLSWTQPVRMGGLQVQRNFTARPDIITQALPSFSGSAAAPSTVDVYVNNIKTYSQAVGAGPFQLSNIPTPAANGEARIVIRDASGREVETKQAFYNAPTLLRPGLYEYSAEAGFARYNYGIASNDYGTSPIGTVTLRTGMTDWLTLEAHAEGGLGLANGGAGVVVNVLDHVVVSAAVSGSRRSDGGTGLQLYGGFDTQVGIVTVHGSTTRALDKYEDLAVATARLRPTTAFEAEREANARANTRYDIDYRPFSSRDTLSVALPIAFDRSTISATYVRSEYTDRPTDQIMSVSYSRPLIAGATLFATAYTRVDEVKNTGFYVGASMPIGDLSTAVGVTKSAQGITVAADASKPLGTEPGNWGWRVRDAEGANANRQGAIAYRSTAARMEASIQQDETSVRQTAEVSGAIVSMGGNIHFANTIDDGFAVVNAGTSGVRVMSENRFVGETDDNGHLLVPGLRSNQLNTISIDPTNLSISAEVDEPTKQVVPAFKSGVYVDFKVRREGTSAIVIFKKANGAYVDAGTQGALTALGETFLVGYEGQAFIRNLQPDNTVTIGAGQAGCTASFEFVAKRDTQVVVGPVVCK